MLEIFHSKMSLLLSKGQEEDLDISTQEISSLQGSDGAHPRVHLGRKVHLGRSFQKREKQVQEGSTLRDGKQSLHGGSEGAYWSSG